MQLRHRLLVIDLVRAGAVVLALFVVAVATVRQTSGAFSATTAAAGNSFGSGRGVRPRPRLRHQQRSKHRLAQQRDRDLHRQRPDTRPRPDRGAWPSATSTATATSTSSTPTTPTATTIWLNNGSRHLHRHAARPSSPEQTARSGRWAIWTATAIRMPFVSQLRARPNKSLAQQRLPALHGQWPDPRESPASRSIAPEAIWTATAIWTQAFVANYEQAPNKVWLNNGSGTFTDSGLKPGNRQRAPERGIRRHGRRRRPGRFRRQRQQRERRSGSTTAPERSPARGQTLDAATTEGVALGDVDGDGDLDLTYANDGSANTIWLPDGWTTR